MIQSFTPSRRTFCGPRIVKTSRGIISMAAVIGVAVLLVPMSAAAQGTTPLDCLPGSTGPTSGDATPYGGGMCDLGAIGAGSSSALGVSANGQVVVGFVDEVGDISGFSWSSQNGMVALEPLSTTSATVRWRPRNANEDGSIIVGNARNDLNRPRFVRWVNGTIEDLGTLVGFGASSSGNAMDVNNDGTIVVGWTTGVTQQRAVRWVEGGTVGVAANPEMADLGTLRANQLGNAIAWGVNGDGTVVVGNAANDTTVARAFRWVEGGTVGIVANPQMQELGTLRTDQTGLSTAWNINADGKIVVGEAANDSSDTRAFRWVEGGTAGVAENPEMEDLGTLRTDQSGGAVARGVSADGSIVVGDADTDSGVHLADADSGFWEPDAVFPYTGQ